MQEVVEGRINAASDTEVIQEILYRYGALRRWEIGARIAEDLLAILSTLYPFTAEDARRTVELFKRYGPKGLSARDCAHAAVMKNRGLTEILSTDGHFDEIEGIRRLDPRALYEEAAD